ncbi:MAG: hypothetical protein IJU58_00825 [Clostridia bacterium]|nr:hypothetical protein [Clostridia bacterium]
MNKLMAWLDKSRLITKLKGIKHLNIILLTLLVALILIIWFADFGTNTNEKQTSTSTSGTNTLSDYTTLLETKLSKTLSQIEGAGNVDVMITLDGASQLILAYDTESRTNSTDNTTASGTSTKSNNTTTNSTPIIITKNGQSEPLVLSEIMPNIKGVVVVCEGANNIRVKLNILQAVQALLGVNSGQIEIFVKG